MTRFGYIAVTQLALLVIGGSALSHPLPRLVWNATASAPIGLYALQPVHEIHRHQQVAVRPPEPIATYLAKGGYLPKGVLLLKQVLAVHGQTVCRFGTTITIDGTTVGLAKLHDHLGRRLPVWQGCHHLRHDQVFLMNPAVEGSLDGRYFGPFPAATIIATAHPVWTDETGDGHFVWHARRH